MDAIESVILQASANTLVAVVIGFVLFKLLHPGNHKRSGWILGRMWMSWAVMFAAMAKAPHFFDKFDIESFIWWIAQAFGIGIIAYSLGVLFFHAQKLSCELWFRIRLIDLRNTSSFRELFKQYVFLKHVKPNEDLDTMLEAHKVATEELLSGNLNRIIWKTALSECNHDTDLAKDNYLKIRVKQLSKRNKQQSQANGNTSESQPSRWLGYTGTLAALLISVNNFLVFNNSISNIALTKAVNINSNQVAEVKLDESEVLFNKGIIYSNDNRHQEAIDAFQQSLHINPNHAVVWYNLGTNYSKFQPKLHDAIEAYKQALNINPKFSAAWYDLGMAYLTTGNNHGAIEVYKALQSIDADKANALYGFIKSETKPFPKIQTATRDTGAIRYSRASKSYYDMDSLNVYGATASGNTSTKPKCEIKPVMTDQDIAKCK